MTVSSTPRYNALTVPRVVVLLVSLVVAGVGLAGTLLYLVWAGDPRVEQAMCRYLVCSEETLIESGYQGMYRGGTDSAAGALAAFREAVRRDAANPDRWCDLAEAMAQYGQTDQASRCFARALELGPNSPQVWLRAANFHFRIGDNPTALDHFAQVLKRTPVYEPMVFSTYGLMGLPAVEILHRGIPSEPLVARSYFRYLLGQGTGEDIDQAWRWVTAKSFADDRLAGEYVENLLRQRRYEEAMSDWKQHLGPRGEAYRRSSYLYNGDFEQEPTGSVFDWRMGSGGGVTAGFDREVFHSGRQSLRVELEGKENAADGRVGQKAVLEEGAYRLSGYVKTEGLSTDRGLELQVSEVGSSRRQYVRSEELLGTNDWMLIEKAFAIPPGTHLVEVRIGRTPSLKFDNKIRGTLWLDGVALEKVEGRNVDPGAVSVVPRQE